LVARLKWTAVILVALTALATGASVAAYSIRISAREDSLTPRPLPGSMPQANPQAATKPPEPPAADKDRLQGTWIVMAAEQGGRSLDSLNGRRLGFAGDRFTVSPGPGEVSGIIPSREMQGDFTLEVASPNRIDLYRGNWRLQGVYALEGKELRICLGEANEPSRPMELASKMGSNQLLLVLRPE